MTLGTGIGVAACFDGVMQLDPLGKPAAGISIWSRPFRGATVEDVVSARAIIARYRAMDAGFDRSRGVKGLAEAARSGDALALDALLGSAGDRLEIRPSRRGDRATLLGAIEGYLPDGL